MRDLARIFKALADETRLQMMALILLEGELCVCDCMQVLDIGQSKASRHLRYLANAGLLDDRREGTWVYYKVARELDEDRKTVLRAVGELVPSSRIEEIIKRLNEWSRQKKAGATSCSAT